MAVMYALTYMNSSQIADHARLSQTRLFMTLMMGGAMALVMLGFMRHNYTHRRANIGIVAGALGMIALGLFLVRSQATVADVAYMKGMIPHHSIAILTSSNATIDDVRVRALANEIIAAQVREIEEMEWLIDDIQANGPATSQEQAETRPVPDFSGTP